MNRKPRPGIARSGRNCAQDAQSKVDPGEKNRVCLTFFEVIFTTNHSKQCNIAASRTDIRCLVGGSGVACTPAGSRHQDQAKTAVRLTKRNKQWFNNHCVVVSRLRVARVEYGRDGVPLSKALPLLFAAIFGVAQAQTTDTTSAGRGSADQAAVEEIDPNIRCVAIAMAFEQELNAEQKSQPLVDAAGARAVVDTALFLYGLDTIKVDLERASPKDKARELIDNGLYAETLASFPDKVVENYQGWFRIHALEYELIQCAVAQNRQMLERFEALAE